MMDFIVKSLSQVSFSSSFLGGKGLGLYVCSTIPVQIPKTIVLSADLFREYLNQIEEKKIFTSSGYIASFNETLPVFSQQLKDILQETWDLFVAEGVSKLAVRSSAVVEDSYNSSFAGHLITKLRIQSYEEFEEAVKLCLASTFSAHVGKWKEIFNMQQSVADMALVIQEFITGEVSGVSVTYNPSNGDNSQIGIEAAPGPCKGIVDGSVETEYYEVDKVTLDIRSTRLRKINEEVMTASMQNKQMPSLKTGISCLNNHEIQMIAKEAYKIEKAFKKFFHTARPLNIEWTMRRDADLIPSLVTLQARPEPLLYARSC
jgi:phosphoenolpyruvate synthase/pyruvate phosphate dikinase